MASRGHLLLTSVIFAACATPTPEVRRPNDTATTTHPASTAHSVTPKAKAQPHGEITELETIEKDIPTTPTPAPKAKAVLARGPSPLPQGTVVLHVGDSMADALGKSLRRELGQRGIKNILKAKEATYIPQWAGFTMNFPALVAHNKPDLVIVTLGGNEVAMPDPSIRAEPVRRIVKAIGDRPCLWIAPPLWPGAPHTGILDVIRKNCAPCRYVDSNVLIPDLKRLGDRVHPTIRERKRWARFMIRWLEYNIDPKGNRPWDFHNKLIAPPPETP